MTPGGSTEAPFYVVHIVLQPHLVSQWFDYHEIETDYDIRLIIYMIRLLPIRALETLNITSKALLTCNVMHRS